MSYKADLESYIRESYSLILEYEDILRLANDPREKLRARRAIDEQWMYIKDHLDEYIRVCERLRLSIADDLVQIIARFPQHSPRDMQRDNLWK